MKKEDASELIICAICLDSVPLDDIKNVSVLSIYNTKEELWFLGKGNTSNTELYITPCGHCFHRDCL